MVFRVGHDYFQVAAAAPRQPGRTVLRPPGKGSNLESGAKNRFAPAARQREPLHHGLLTNNDWLMKNHFISGHFCR